MTTCKMRASYLSLLLLALLFTPKNAVATIRYTISLAHPEQHLFHVTMTVPNAGRELVVAMPAWNATYDIRDFAYRVTQVRATGAEHGGIGAALRVVKTDKQTWKITARRGDSRANLGTVTIQYEDHWDQPGPFSSQLDARHAFLNLAEVLFYVPTRRAEESDVQYTTLPGNWRVAEELPAGKAAESFTAASYDALVDAPAEIGTFREFQLDAGHAHLRVVIDGKDWDQNKLTDTLRKIVSYETGMMRDVPFHEYMFILHFGPYAEMGGGGMEHANCTAIAVPSGDMVADVAAHEFFHLWNVKRIRPQSLQPVDYTKEMWTRSLWFAEGVTSAYASYTMVRTGLWTHEQFYSDLARQFTMLEARPAHLWQSAEESSLDTWLDKYDYYNRPEVSISYYNKGQILGVMLDLAIREATDNHKSLDDVMRAMDGDYARRGRFYDGSAAVEREAEKVAGRSFKNFFEKYVSGTAEIPYRKFLQYAGLDVNAQERAVADFGFEISRGRGGPMRIGGVTPGSGAEQAGLHSGDALLELDGQPFPRFAQQFLLQHTPGDTVKLRIERSGREREVSLTLGKKMVKTYSISEMPGASAKERRIRDGMLTGATD
ncbi:MAG TPA: PDZ domain-containing protein [Candidatus Limnocylindrales bacterium]|nr:PDZ domain-containing protein [Candidatus Limnocylindrales bacterium]